jgi:hypothetical protein
MCPRLVGKAYYLVYEMVHDMVIWSDNDMNILDDIRVYLDQKGSELTCDMFKYAAVIEHQDGSKFNLQNVIIEEKRFGQLDVYLAWTEHCGYFYFFKDDLRYFYKYRNNGFAG